jgi:predicted transcriptional regulator
LAVVRARLADSRYGFCLVVNERRVLLGRVRKSTLDEGDADATVERVMESGPSTVRPSESAAELVDSLAARDLRIAILTTPEGVLFGILDRADAERRLAERAK